MESKHVELVILDHYCGNRKAIEIFADLAAQSLRNRRTNTWTPPQNSDILKAPTVKS